MTLYKMCVGDLRVPLRHGQICMTHLLLEGKQIAAILKPEGSEAVSDLVGGELRAGAFTVSPEVPSQNIGFHLQAISGWEQPVLPFTRLNLQKLLQSGVGCGRKKDCAALTGLSDFWTNHNRLEVRIVVTIQKGQDLTGSDAGIKHDHCNVVVPQLAVVVFVQTPQEALYILNGGGLDVPFVLNLLQIQLIEGVVGDVVLFGAPRKQCMEVLIRMVIPRRTGGGDIGKVVQNLPLQHINIHGIG